ncbi:MAG: hypothetical protein ABJZ18_07540 [Algibacter sp.]
MIKDLRQQEIVTLHNNILKIEDSTATPVVEFLKHEYIQEALEYPRDPPPFNKDAAIWASKTVYIVAQLILYREHKEVELVSLLPEFEYEITASSILSADLCLRFLPEMIKQLSVFDVTDAIIPLLEDILLNWHYSGIDYSLDIYVLSFDTIQGDDSLLQMYTDRIIKYKKTQLAKHILFYPLVAAHLGDFSSDLWNDFKK